MVSIFSRFFALRRRVLVRTPFCLAANQSEARGIKLKGRENFAAHGWVFNNGPVCPDCRKVGGTSPALTEIRLRRRRHPYFTSRADRYVLDYPTFTPL